MQTTKIPAASIKPGMQDRAIHAFADAMRADLLAALKALVDQVERGDFDHIGADHPSSAVHAARVAIANAEGGEA